jgi:hypothetical protein
VKRTDTHRPSAIVPDEYTYVGQECIKIYGFGDCAAQIEMRARIAAHMKQTGGQYASHVHGGNCMVCGSVNAIYTVLFHHVSTNTYVRMGQDCAIKCDMGGDFRNSAFRAAVDDARKHHAGKAKAQAILGDNGVGSAWDVYSKQESSQDWPYEERTIKDIVGKLVQYGSVSDNSMRFLKNLVDRIEHRAEIQAARDRQRLQEAMTAADCPSGRIDVEGVILSMREDESDYGVVTKCLVKTDAGYKVWGTLPVLYRMEGTRAYSQDAAKGDRISFRATVTQSDKDSKFGFYKRPTGGRLITATTTNTDALAAKDCRCSRGGNASTCECQETRELAGVSQ